MTLKEFFKPTLWKIVVTIVLSIVVILIKANTMVIACPMAEGYDCSPEIQQARIFLIEFSLIWIFISYLLTCIIFVLVTKFKK